MRMTEALLDGLQRSGQGFRILGGRLLDFPTVLLDSDLSGTELFLQLQVGVE